MNLIIIIHIMTLFMFLIFFIFSLLIIESNVIRIFQILSFRLLSKKKN
jgi:hypothetical protein